MDVMNHPASNKSTYGTQDLSGKTVLITGGSGGIGRACVKAFTQCGARVVMTDLDGSGRPLCDALGADSCRFVEADIACESDVQKLMETTVSAFGGLDVLVNNAAVTEPCLPVHDTVLEEFDRLVNINFRGVFLCCKYAYAYLKEARGCIVNMSSMAGVQGERDHAVYSATKGALNALTKCMAVDYGVDGIRCNAICPSSVLTPNSDRQIAAMPDAETIVEQRKKINLRGYTAMPDEIASVAVFLASSAASFMTGAIVPVSGGSECGYGIKT